MNIKSILLCTLLSAPAFALSPGPTQCSAEVKQITFEQASSIWIPDPSGPGSITVFRPILRDSDAASLTFSVEVKVEDAPTPGDLFRNTFTVVVERDSCLLISAELDVAIFAAKKPLALQCQKAAGKLATEKALELWELDPSQISALGVSEPTLVEDESDATKVTFDVEILVDPDPNSWPSHDTYTVVMERNGCRPISVELTDTFI
jgi:hypothetical protein